MRIEPAGFSSLRCVGADGVPREFHYELEFEDEGTLLCRVHRREQMSSEDHWFDLTLRALDRESLVVVMMQHNWKEWYQAKGIPDALIPALADRLGKMVCSSSNSRKKYPDESRNEPASKVWCRIVAVGRATYDSAGDRYVCRPSLPSSA